MSLNLTLKIVTALLPRDYREHVIGDLKERGFRLRDAISILPSVWISYFRRTRIPWLNILCGFLAGGSLAVLMKMPYSIGSIFIVMYVVDAWRRKLHFRWKQFSTQMMFVFAAMNAATYFGPVMRMSRQQQDFFAFAVVLLFMIRQIQARRLHREINRPK